MNSSGKVILIRHGKTKGNLEKRYVGTTEESILAVEKQRIYRLASREQIKGVPISNLFVSPMDRCIETAMYLYPHMEQRLVPDFRECDFGDFEYGNYEELSHNPQYQKWIDSNGTMAFPNGEEIADFKRRCQKAFQHTVNRSMEEGNIHMAYVVHGGTIMAILDAFALPHKSYFHWQVENLEGYLGDIMQVDKVWKIRNLEKV